MKAAVRYRYGGPEQVRVEELEAPVAGEGEVLVRVHTASVNRADLDYIGPRPQFIRAFVGHAPAEEPAARDGRRGHGRGGRARRDEVQARRPRVRRPPAVRHGLVRRARRGQGEGLPADPGRHRLRHRLHPAPRRGARDPGAADAAAARRSSPATASSSTGRAATSGPFAVQIAKWKGAEVTGVCRTEKVEFVRSLGVDHVLDYRTTDFTTQPERYDWIIASDSHHSIRSVRRALRPGGQYATLGGGSKDILESMVIGKLSSIGSSKWAGIMLWWKPFHEPDVADAHGARPRGDAQARDRHGLPARPDPRGAGAGPQRRVAGQGADQGDRGRLIAMRARMMGACRLPRWTGCSPR